MTFSVIFLSLNSGHVLLILELLVLELYYGLDMVHCIPKAFSVVMLEGGGTFKR
jgi:hypothetical protein